MYVVSDSLYFPVSASANYKYTPIEDNKAQQKFGNAKAISSDMFFQDRDPNTEMRSTLAQYEGSTSISSADLFGGGQNQRQQQSAYSSLQVSVVKINVAEDGIYVTLNYVPPSQQQLKPVKSLDAHYH